MAKRQLTPEFREFLECLNRAKVEYLLVGGFAVNYFDFWVAVSDENFDRLLQSVRLFFGEDLPGLDKTFLKNNDTLYLGRVPNRIEIIQNADGVTFADAASRCVRTELDGVAVNVISLADLRANKKASARYNDLADIENLPEA